MAEDADNSKKGLTTQTSGEGFFSATASVTEKNLAQPPESPSKKKKDKDRPPSPKKAKATDIGANSPSSLVKLSDFADCVPLLRNEAFFTDNVKSLEGHKFILDMQNGKLSTNRAKKFVAEAYYVIKSDMRSFEVAYTMYGLSNDTYGKFFEFLRIGCKYADEHLDKLRMALKLTTDELDKYEPTTKSHCYTAYFSWLITHTCPAVIAVCYVLNYPIWAKMCHNMAEAIKANPKYRLSEADCAYFRFMSQPLDDMDIMAREIFKLADKDETLRQKWYYKRIKDSVRMLQGYLIEFWDAVYTGAYCA